MKVLAGAAVLMTLTMFSGCASILNEKTQKVNVSASNGQSITGTIDGVAFTAPGVVEVTRAKADKVVTVETPGCAKSTAMQKSVDSKFFINVLSGGAFGSTTDYATEKMWKYEDNVVISCK